MQIVGYETSPTAALLVAGEGGLERVALDPGGTLSFALEERRCAGELTPDGHVSCTRSTAPYCDVHAETWICARCTGTCLKDEMDCFEEHVVYLAAFAPATFKVGVTRAWRFETRLREQGADRGARIHTVANGRIARELEAEIATELTDRVPTSEKVRGLHRSVDEPAWTAVLERFEPTERVRLEYGFDLAEPAIPETVARGTVVGTKGRVLAVELAGSVYGVDLRDLVGYGVREGPTDRDLQAGLGAFG